MKKVNKTMQQIPKQELIARFLHSFQEQRQIKSLVQGHQQKQTPSNNTLPGSFLCS